MIFLCVAPMMSSPFSWGVYLNEHLLREVVLFEALFCCQLVVIVHEFDEIVLFFVVVAVHRGLGRIASFCSEMLYSSTSFSSWLVAAVLMPAMIDSVRTNRTQDG